MREGELLARCQGVRTCARCVNDEGRCILKTYNYCNTLIKEKNKHEDQPDNSLNIFLEEEVERIIKYKKIY
ncbi:hypothetical protein A7M48_19805 [Acinetobacter baumannii]|nr:hypothetical protein A7M48_19805 [Acinetobacter baumannii]